VVIIIFFFNTEAQEKQAKANNINGQFNLKIIVYDKD
jgi:hypothetical protein